jgi:ATP-dependent DNA helicase HFM1/MER3
LKAGLRRAEHHAGSLLHEAPQARSGQRYIFHEQDQVQQYDDSVNKPQYQDQTMRDATQQESVDVNDQSHHAMFRSNTQQAPKPATKRHVPAGPPTCQGIQLVSISNLPDRLRTVFPYPLFNAVQSKCFDQVFKSDDNFVLASPTGSGKTVILEWEGTKEEGAIGRVVENATSSAHNSRTLYCIIA